MRTKLIPAIAGLGLALLLAVTATGGAGAGSSADSADSEDTSVVAAQTGTAVTVPVVETLVPTVEDVDTHRAAPGPTPAEIAEYVDAVEQAKLADYLAAVEQAEADAAAAARQAQAAAPVNAAPGSVQDIIVRHFGSQAQKAIAVARCESGLNPSAMSPGGGNHGLFQINNVHRGNFQAVTGVAWSGRYDADANTRFAKWLFNQSGWGPWACA